MLMRNFEKNKFELEVENHQENQKASTTYFNILP